MATPNGWNVQSWNYIVYDKTDILSMGSIFDGRLKEETVKKRVLEKFQGQNVKIVAEKSHSNSTNSYINLRNRVLRDIEEMNGQS